MDIRLKLILLCLFFIVAAYLQFMMFYQTLIGLY